MTALALYPEEVATFAPPERKPVSEWSAQHRMIRAGAAARPGRYSLEVAPYAAEILDTILDEDCDEVYLMFGAQLGKSTIMENLVGYVVDQDPSPVMWLMPAENDYHVVHGTRILPMIEDSPQIAKHLTGRADDVSQEGIQFDTCRLFYANARATRTIKGRTIRVLLADEIDEMADTPQGDPLSMAKQRTNTYSSRRFVVASSTPTTPNGKIARRFEKTDKRRFHVPCPHCGTFQVLSWDHVRWDDHEDHELARKAAHYLCGACEGRIDEAQRKAMVLRGVWVPEGAYVDDKGRVRGEVKRRLRGYHLPSLYSLMMTLGECVERFLNEDLADFMRQTLAEPYDDGSDGISEDELEDRIGTYEFGTVPSDAVLLTAGVDVQGHRLGLFYVIRAWAANGESWLVRAGRTRDWQGVEDAVFSGKFGDLFVNLAFVDAGDGNRADEVYEFCRGWPTRAYPSKGKQTLEKGKPFITTTIDKHPITGAALKSGMKLWTLNTVLFKDMLAQFIAGDRQPWHLPANDTGRLDEYLKHMRAEQRIDKGGRVVWEKRSRDARNDWWDCEVMALAAWFRLTNLSRRRDAGPEKRKQPPQQRADQRRQAQQDKAPGERKKRGGSDYGGRDWLGGTERW